MLVPRVEVELPEPTRQRVDNVDRISFWADEVYQAAVDVLRPTIILMNGVIFNFSDEENQKDFIHRDLDRGNGLGYVERLDGEPKGFGVFRAYDLNSGGFRFGPVGILERTDRVLYIMDRGFLPGTRGDGGGTKIVDFAMDYFDPTVVIDRATNAAARMSIKVEGPTFPIREVKDKYVSAFYDQYPPAQDLLRVFLREEGLEGQVDLRTGKQEKAYVGGRMGLFFVRRHDTRVISFESVLKDEIQVDRNSGDSVWHMSYVDVLHDHGLFGARIQRFIEGLLKGSALLDKELPVA